MQYLFCFFLFLILSCAHSDPKKGSAQEKFSTTFTQAIKMYQNYKDEYPAASEERQSELQHDLIEFESETLLPDYDRACQFLFKNNDFILMSDIYELITKYKETEGSPLAEGLALIFRKNPDFVEESFQKLNQNMKSAVHQILTRGWKAHLKDQLHNDWTLELTQRLKKMEP